MAYTGHSDYSSAEPPTFVVVGEQDGIAPPAVMKRRVEALRKAGTPVEYREYEGLGHGFGLGTGTIAEGWVFDAIRFWETSLRRHVTSPRARQVAAEELGQLATAGSRTGRSYMSMCVAPSTTCSSFGSLGLLVHLLGSRRACRPWSRR